MVKNIFYGKDEKKYFAFLCKLHERLVIILDDNVAKGSDPIESDIQLMEELYQIYDNCTLPWLKEGIDVEQTVSQSILFTDKTS